MKRRKSTDRQEIIAHLQSRGPLTPEERPIVFVTPIEVVELTPEEAARYRAEPLPNSGEQLCLAALDTFNRTLGDRVPLAIPHLLGELSYKLQAMEYHLRKVGGDGIEQWFEAEAAIYQARSSLEILARILHEFIKQVKPSFRSDGRPIANVLKQQPRFSPQYASSIQLAALVEAAGFIETLSAVRDEISHWSSFPTLTKARTGTVHLAGMDLDQFCIGMWLQLMPFSRHFLEWTIDIACRLAPSAGESVKQEA